MWTEISPLLLSAEDGRLLIKTPRLSVSLLAGLHSVGTCVSPTISFMPTGMEFTRPIRACLRSFQKLNNYGNLLAFLWTYFFPGYRFFNFCCCVSCCCDCILGGLQKKTSGHCALWSTWGGQRLSGCSTGSPGPFQWFQYQIFRLWLVAVWSSRCISAISSSYLLRKMRTESVFSGHIFLSKSSTVSLALIPETLSTSPSRSSCEKMDWNEIHEWMFVSVSVCI